MGGVPLLGGVTSVPSPQQTQTHLPISVEVRVEPDGPAPCRGHDDEGRVVWEGGGVVDIEHEAPPAVGGASGSRDQNTHQIQVVLVLQEQRWQSRDYILQSQHKNESPTQVQSAVDRGQPLNKGQVICCL